MKFLDEKGRLFGKINLIDLLVVLMVIIVVAAVAWKLGGSKLQDALSNEQIPTVKYEVVCPGISNDACEYAKTCIGDQLMNSGNLLDGQITGVSVEPYYITCVDGQGNTVAAQDAQNSTIRFTIECKTPYVDNAYAAGTQEIRVGKSHIVKSIHLEVIGCITQMEVVTADE